MTFEEFIAKKKIDLALFKSADPSLFAEFQSHYSQMGAKSFDHSKKFLFNKLRRTYHLKEEPKSTASEPVEINKIASQAEPLLSPTVEATIYTPRFRGGEKAKSTPDTEKTDLVKSEKPAYTPRFRQNQEPSTKNQDAESVKLKAENLPSENPDTESAIPKAESFASEGQESKSNNHNSEHSSKPAYVPRFKPTLKPKPSPPSDL